MGDIDRLYDKVGDINVECDIPDSGCLNSSCSSPRYYGTLFCETHLRCLHCSYDGYCTNKPNSGYNYCSTHYASNKVCDKGGCTKKRSGNNREYCDIHLRFFN